MRRWSIFRILKDVEDDTDDFQYWGFTNTVWDDNGSLSSYFGKVTSGFGIIGDKNDFHNEPTDITTDYGRLLSNLNRVQRESVAGIGWINEKSGYKLNPNLAYWDSEVLEWAGSCYGMSVVALLINNGEYRFDDYRFGKDISTLQNIHSADNEFFERGHDSVEVVESIINFYQAQQPLALYDKQVSFLSENPTELDRIRKVVETITAKEKEGKCALIRYSINGTSGHAIIGISCKDLNENDKYYPTYKHCIETYDPNAEVPRDPEYNIYYNDNSGDYYIPYWAVENKQIDRLVVVDDISVLAPVDYKTGRYVNPGKPIARIEGEGDCTLINKAGTVLIEKNEIKNNTGDFNYIILPISDNGNEGGYRVNLPESEYYSIKSNAIAHSLITENRIVRANAPKGGTATLNKSGVADITSDYEGEMSLEVVDNEASGSIPTSILIEANNVKKLSEKKEAGGIVVDADDFSNLKITTDDESVICKPTDDKVLIKEDEGGIKVYEDEDKDGSFEKEIKTGDATNKTGMMVVGQKIDLKATFFSGFTDTISRYVVDNNKLASVSKQMLSGKKPGTVKVTAQKQIGKNQYEPVGECTVTILSKPKLKFTKPMTYVGQTINATDYFQTEDTKTLGATYWESAKSGVVEVADAKTGMLKAKGNGQAKITAYFGEKDKAGTYKVSATIAVKVPSFQKNEYTLQTGGKLTLSMKNVTGALDPEWHAEDVSKLRVMTLTNIKKVKTGKVAIEGLSCGDTKLIAVIDGQEYECTVHVTKPVINKSSMEIKVGKSGTVSLKNTKIKKADIKWESSKPSVATVDANGKIIGVSAGEAIIFTDAGGCHNECKVTVK